MEIAGPSTSSSLRIALVCPYSLSRPGGVQGQVIGLARAQEAAGHRATVFAPLDDAGDAPAGVDLVATGRSVSLPANGSMAPVSLSVLSAARALHSLRSMSFDVVHVHEPFTPGLPYGLLVGRDIPPMVATFHRNGGSALYTLLGPLVRRLAGRLAVRTAVSEAARATASHALGGTYEVGFNGIELDRYRDVVPWPTDRPTILFLGRHEERKGLRVLLEAFDRLIDRPGHATPRGDPPTAPTTDGHGFGSRATDPSPPPSGVTTPGRPTSSGWGSSPRTRRCDGWRRPRSCAHRPSEVSRSAWCCSRPWRRGHRWWPVTSTATGRRPAGVRCWFLRATLRSWPMPWPGSSPGSWRWPAARPGRTGRHHAGAGSRPQPVGPS